MINKKFIKELVALKEQLTKSINERYDIAQQESITTKPIILSDEIEVEKKLKEAIDIIRKNILLNQK